MHARTLLGLAPAFLLLTGCFGLLGGDSDDDGISNKDEEAMGTDPDSADSDGDGLNDGDEIEFGTDPLNPDSDDDRLSDGDEKSHGTDPLVTDTDDDGYLDGWEVAEGSDPLDASSVIYAGGWPYNPDKDAMETVSVADAGLSPGDLFPRVKLMDQFGDEVDLYDFSMQGVPVLIDISAEWCPPCHDVSDWLAHGDASYDNYFKNIRQNIADGKFYWVTVMGQDNYGNPPELDVLQEWYEDYPDEHVPILGDDGTVSSKYVTYGWPTFILLDEDMTLLHISTNDSNYYDAIWEADAL